jgi:hypothetical protein
MKKVPLLILLQATYVNTVPLYRRQTCGNTITVKSLVTVTIPANTATRNGQSFHFSYHVRCGGLYNRSFSGTAEALPNIDVQDPGTVGVVLTTL